MKKIIACLLALCMVASITEVGWNGLNLGASAESAETTQTVAAEPTSAPAQAGQTSAPSVGSEATAAPTASDSDGASQADTDASADDPTVAPETADATVSESPTDAQETLAPEETVDPDATLDPDATEGAEVTAEVTNTPVPEANVGSGPAWIVEGAHRRYGELDELLPIVIVNGQTLYLCTSGVITLTNYTANELKGISFGLDSDALGEDFCSGKSVIISTISPSGATRDGTLYIWIGHASDVPTPEEMLGDEVEITDDDADLLETEIRVDADNYSAEEPCAPTFTLTAYPELTEGMTFGVILDDGDAAAMDGQTCSPTVSGTYCFVVLDTDGTLKARSMAYTLLYQEPEETDPLSTLTPEPTDAEATPTPEPTETPLTEEDVLKSVTLAAAEGEPDALELTVLTYNYADNTLTSVTPSFELTGAPSYGGYYYGISINGRAMARLRSNTYAETDSGEYTFVFYLLDADDNVVDTSAEYHVLLDYAQANADNEAWMAVGDVRLYGTLSSLLSRADAGANIYLLTRSVLPITNTSKLSSVNLLADPDTFDSDACVITDETSPDGTTAEGTIFAWIGSQEDESQYAMVLLSSAPTFSIDLVTVGDRTLADNLWVNGSDAINFTLTDAVAGHSYTYQVAVDGGAYQAFSGTLGGLGLTSGNTYTLDFLVSVADDLTNCQSAQFTVSYDNVAPVLLCKAGTDNMLSFYAGDAISGLYVSGDAGAMANVSFQSGASWAYFLTYAGENVYTYSVQYKGSGTISAGTLAVRDKANNVTKWGSDITISSQTGSGSMSGGTTGNATGGTTTRTVYHSSSSYTTVTAYNGVSLVVETGTMSALTIGDQTLDLTLSLLPGAQGNVPEGVEPAFTADFTTWDGDGEETDDAQSETGTNTVDTLVLSAADATLTDGQYCWTFDGSVYKKLAASGIDYLALTVGDQVTALSTAGFAAGIRYNMYRASGLASKSFVYTVSMNADGSGSPEITVTVDGNTYTLTGDATSEFYYYNVYSGSTDMLNSPFGQTDGQSTAAAGRKG